jgi:ADP-ribose pyrophosphatase YjhB (NUDIX family)
VTESRPHLLVSAVVLDEGALRTLLVRTEDVPRWSLISGHTEGGETLTEGALRQVREKSGAAVMRVIEPHVAVQQDRFDCGVGDAGAVRHIDHVFAVIADPAEALRVEPGVAAEWFPVLALPEPLAPGVRLHIVGSARSLS